MTKKETLQEVAIRALAAGPTITLTLDEVRAVHDAADEIERLQERVTYLDQFRLWYGQALQSAPEPNDALPLQSLASEAGTAVRAESTAEGSPLKSGAEPKSPFQEHCPNGDVCTSPDACYRALECLARMAQVATSGPRTKAE